MSKKPSQSSPKKELGVIGLVLTMVFLGFVAFFWQDATGYPYHFYGMVWWAGVVFMAFTVGMLYYALFVLPIAGNAGWAEGLRLLVRNFLSPALKVDEKPKGRGKKEKTAVMPHHLADLPPSFLSLGSGIVRNHQALALIKGGGFSRSAGPGFVTLFNKETIAQIVDVRRHARSEIVKANTRDGIPVEVPVFVNFRVWQDEETIAPGNRPYPYNPDAIFHVNYAGSVLDGESASRWSDLITPLAANLFVTEVARWTLEELYETDSDGNGAKAQINEAVKRSLERNDRLEGIDILSVGSGIMMLPDVVREQRLKKWQSQWQRKIILNKARRDAEVELRMKHARARAQIEIIQSIMQSIAATSRSDISITEVVALRMVEALEEAVTDVSVRALVPQPILTTMVESSRQMLAWIDEENA